MPELRIRREVKLSKFPEGDPDPYPTMGYSVKRNIYKIVVIRNKGVDKQTSKERM